MKWNVGVRRGDGSLEVDQVAISFASKEGDFEQVVLFSPDVAFVLAACIRKCAEQCSRLVKPDA